MDMSVSQGWEFEPNERIKGCFINFEVNLEDCVSCVMFKVKLTLFWVVRCRMVQDTSIDMHFCPINTDVAINSNDLSRCNHSTNFKGL